MPEIDDLLKKAMKSVGHYTISACELDTEKLQLASSLENPSRTPILVNRIRTQERAVAEMNEKVNSQEKTAVQDIIEVAEKYRDLFSFGLVEVREGIEEAMAKFGNVISQDTLTQINKESAAINGRLSNFSDEQQKRLSAVANELKTKIQHFDEKYEQLKETTDKHSKSVDRLSAANTNSIQNISKISSKFQTLSKTQQDLQGMLDNELDQLNKRIDGYKSTMEKVSQKLSASLREDMEYLANKMTAAQKSVSSNRKTIEKFNADFTSIRKQLMPLLRSSSSTPTLSSTSTTTTPASNEPDAEIIAMKSSVKQMEMKLQQVQQMVNALAHNDEPPTIKPVDKSVWDEVPKRLDNLEKYTIHLLSAVELLEPKYKQSITELKTITNSPNSNENSNSPNSNNGSNEHTSTSSRGTKRPLEVVSDTEVTLLSEIRRLEFKLSNLVDFVHQFRSTILDPSFPEKLEQGFQRLETSLRNHEMFIAYLVDPQSVMQHIMMDASTDLTLVDSEQSQQQPAKMTPALLTTIAQFIDDETRKSLQREKDNIQSHQSKKQKTIDLHPDKKMDEHMEKQMKQMVAEQVGPLKKKIQDLENQLRKKAQHK